MSEPAEWPAWKTLPAGVLLILVVQALVVPVGVFVHAGLGYALALVLGGAAAFVSVLRHPALFLAGILSIAAAGLGILKAGALVELRAAEVLRDVGVGEAPGAPAGAFVFTAPTHLPELSGSYTRTTRSRSGGTTKVTYAVYPVVPPGWREGEPVPVWAVRGGVGGRRDPEAGDRAGVRIREHERSAFREAVAAACAAHGLTDARDAAILRFAPSLEEADAALVAELALVEKILLGSWLLLGAGFLALARD